MRNCIKKLIPKYIINRVKKRNINVEFAEFILDSAIEYSNKINGDTSSFERRLKSLIKNGRNDCNSIIQDILTAFIPNYEKNLFQYYKKQEYLIFYRFLTYPYSGDLHDYIAPYEKGLSVFKDYDILEYGAGIPYGLIYSLFKNKNSSINSITIIDLDLIHVDFVQFLIVKMAPEIKLKIFRLTNAESFPKLEGKYNLFFGKDIFEHLSNPQNILKQLIGFSKTASICYFDFRNHGEKIYQHVTPNVEFLADEMKKNGFQCTKNFRGLSEFTRK